MLFHAILLGATSIAMCVLGVGASVIGKFSLRPFWDYLGAGLVLTGFAMMFGLNILLSRWEDL